MPRLGADFLADEQIGRNRRHKDLNAGDGTEADAVRAVPQSYGKRTPCYRVSFSYSVHHRGLLQSLLYIRNDVVYILNAHGEAD